MSKKSRRFKRDQKYTPKYHFGVDLGSGEDQSIGVITRADEDGTFKVIWTGPVQTTDNGGVQFPNPAVIDAGGSEP